jgi:outer membrane protein assembly factor BamB
VHNGPVSTRLSPSGRRWFVSAILLVGVTGASLGAAQAGAAHARTSTSVGRVATTDWPAYLDGPSHDSFNAGDGTITPANASALKQKWSFTTGNGYFSSPTVFDGAVFIGANNGWFYKLSAANGTVVDKIFLGTNPVLSCQPPPTGIVSTATASLNPSTKVPTVYVSGANGYLYAMRASNLAVEWKSVIAIRSTKVNDYYDWSSPTVAGGRIYIGVSSNCDKPLVRGGLISYDQTTGKRLGEFYTVPSGKVGGSIWSSIAVGSNGDVYASTGNGPLGSPAEQLLGYSESIIKLSPTLQFLARFQVPSAQEGQDTDFGASPVLFGPYVGACNKNGVFYALSQTTMKLAWQRQVSDSDYGLEACIATPAWNGKHLFFVTPAIKLGGTSYTGTVQERDPSGPLVWVAGLPNALDGSPTLDGDGVLAAGTYDEQPTPNATYLLDAANGHILRNVVTGGDFAQSVFAEHWLFVANQNGVSAWGAGPLG